MTLDFDPTTHTYTLDGRVLPSVTQLLKPISPDLSVIPAAVLDRKRAIGEAVHKATELLDLGMLDWGSLDEAVVPYVDAYAAFLAGYQPEILGVEERLYHPTLAYAGQSDRYMRIGAQLCEVDLKTTYDIYPVVGPQTAAYAAMRRARGDEVTHRYALQLKPDGSYAFKEQADGQDWGRFLACLTVWNTNRSYYGD